MKTVNVHPQKFNTDEILATAQRRVALVKEMEVARAAGDTAKLNELRAELLRTK